MYGELVQGAMIIIPGIVDYEVRRSLILAGAQAAVGRLDALYRSCIRFLPINTPALKRAAELWAIARRRGEQTAHDHALDADVIFSAQAIEFCSDLDEWQLITENVDSHFAICRRLGSISPVGRGKLVEVKAGSPRTRAKVTRFPLS